MNMPRLARIEVPEYAALLAGLNFYLCHELFRIQYLDNFQSNEGILVTLSKFIYQHFGAKWYPLWNIGLPAENTYEPAVPSMIALLSRIPAISPPLALHVLCAAFFCLIPAGWFYLLWRWGVDAKCAFTGGVIYSLISPSLLVVPARNLLESRRLSDITFYGDIAHMIATGFLPLALLAIERAIHTDKTRYYLAAVVLSVFTSMSDQFGITALALCCLAILASLDIAELPRAAVRVALIGAATYLCVCRVLTPTLLGIISKNSQLLGGDYRFSKRTLIGALILVGGAVAIRYAASRASFVTRFVSLITWIFGSMFVSFYKLHLPVLPVTERYDLEVDLAVCALAAVCLWKVPVRFRRAILAILLLAAVPQTIRTRRLDRLQMRPVDVRQTVEYKSSQWIAQNLPGVRVMSGGGATFWFDYWTDNPQLSGGHDGLAPNYMQRVATFAIYSGENAGERDVDYSIFWMKAYGVGAIYVAGEKSTDKIHPFVHPYKFEGVLPKLWQESDSAIYGLPASARSLARVIPASAVVERQPIHGLDTAPAEAYVRALDDPSFPEASLRWLEDDHATIDTSIQPGQVISVHVTYDPGWVARSGGKPLTVRRDALGQIVIEPASTGSTHIDLEFTGGTARTVLLGISVSTVAGLCLLGLFGPRKILTTSS